MNLCFLNSKVSKLDTKVSKLDSEVSLETRLERPILEVFEDRGSREDRGSSRVMRVSGDCQVTCTYERYCACCGQIRNSLTTLIFTSDMQTKVKTTTRREKREKKRGQLRLKKAPKEALTPGK